MATVDELVEQYETDTEMQKEVEDILADGRITLSEFRSFAKKHDVDISLADLPKYVKQAKQLGFIK